jgi:predicted dehydrogenase
LKVHRENLKAAVVGLGKMGLLHTCILNVMPGVRVVAVCEKSALMRRMAGKALRNVRIVDDVEKLAGLDLDMVYVTTPIPSHFPIAKTIYSVGISRNLFVEKTLGASANQAQELAGLSENFEGTSMVGYMKRFAVTFQKAKSILEQEILGEITSFNAYAYSSDFADASKGSAAGSSRGGVLGDLGSHVIDLSLWFFGDMQVQSGSVESAGHFLCEDHVSFSVKGKDSLRGIFDVSWRMRGYRMPESGLAIVGKRGRLAVNDDEVNLHSSHGLSRWYRHDLNDNVDFLLGGSEYFREDKAFVESAATETTVEPSFRTASKVDCLLEQVKRRTASIE